ncbi:hypothetical protein ACSNOI_22270 [Actinomadura kijaniata]|uniref:hypothetical protein n=1 Tax=Actinomadura kijaniata TaxID=46161 RepID=UPI003F1CB884
MSHALEGFDGEVLGVELSNDRHYGVQQLTDWILIDALLDAHQLTVFRLEFKENVGIIAAIAGKPADLVQDDVIYIPAALDTGQHPLKVPAVDGLGRLPRSLHLATTSAPNSSTLR